MIELSRRYLEIYRILRPFYVMGSSLFEVKGLAISEELMKKEQSRTAIKKVNPVTILFFF